MSIADKPKEISLSFEHIKEDDPLVVRLFALGSKLYDLFEQQIVTIGMTPRSSREEVAKARWTMYIATLFGENYLASLHLAVLHMPRPQITLNRQLFEYYIRNQWWLHYPSIAADLLDSLPKLVQNEISQAKGAVNQTSIDAIEKQYEEWLKTSPLANSKVPQADVKLMVTELTHNNPTREYYFNYSVPSILAHARPHGITDVLKSLGDGQLERHPNSIWFNRIDALSQAIGVLCQYATLLANHFQLDSEPILALNQEFGAILSDHGIVPETVGVKFKK